MTVYDRKCECGCLVNDGEACRECGEVPPAPASYDAVPWEEVHATIREQAITGRPGTTEEGGVRANQADRV